MNDDAQIDQQSLRELFGDIAGRLPAYGQLSARLVNEGRMSAGQQGQLPGPLGAAGGVPMARIARLVPGIGAAARMLTIIGGVRYALTQMQPDQADLHLAAVGLTREQVDADFQTARTLSKQLRESGSREVTRIAEEGARVAGRLAGKGLRAWRKRQAQSADRVEPADEETDR